MRQNTWLRITSSVVVLSLTVSTLGCAKQQRELTPEQFEAAYAAPRLWYHFADYAGVASGSHQLTVYSLGTTSYAHPVGTLTVPVDDMPGSFPSGPQSPVIREPTDSEKAEHARVWRELPRFDDK